MPVQLHFWKPLLNLETKQVVYVPFVQKNRVGGVVKTKKHKPWITRKGKLGGPGFLSKPIVEQHRLLHNCVQKYGYRSCLGSVMVLERNTHVSPQKKKMLKQNRLFLERKYR